ncbi:MAG: transglutaminase domain-containing protein, partial [Candidatus Latescibacterota bacterium]
SAFAGPQHVLKTHPAPGGYSSGMTWDGKALWVADWRAQQLVRMDPQSGEILTILPSPGFSPAGLAWGANRLYVSDRASRRVYVMNPDTKIVERSYPTPGHQPMGLGWDGAHLLLVDSGTDQVYVMNPEDGTVLRSFPAPSGESGGLCYDGQYVWISDRMADTLYRVTMEGTVATMLPAPGPFSAGLAWDGRHLWNADFETDEIYQVDVENWEAFALSDTLGATIEVVHTLRNNGPGTLVGGEIALALPPETLENQWLAGPVTYNRKPDRIETDRWGQRVALFHPGNLDAGGTFTAQYRVTVEVASLQYYLFPEKVGGLEEIPVKILRTYLADGSRLMITDPIIQKTAQKIVGEEKNPYWMARKLHEYVVNKITYKMEGGWDTAPTVLARGTGSCSESTFLLIALCRAVGLPARFEAGSWRRGDTASVDDDNHRWTEIYLPNYGWVPCDPSTGKGASPAGIAGLFGRVGNHLFVTTHGGGDSEYLGWNYNTESTYSFTGTSSVVSNRMILWDRMEKE